MAPALLHADNCSAGPDDQGADTLSGSPGASGYQLPRRTLVSPISSSPTISVPTTTSVFSPSELSVGVGGGTSSASLPVRCGASPAFTDDGAAETRSATYR